MRHTKGWPDGCKSEWPEISKTGIETI